MVKEARDQAYRALATVLDLREGFTVAPPADPRETRTLPADAREQALRSRPGERVSLQLEAADAQIDAALWRWAPTISAFGNARVLTYKGLLGRPVLVGVVGAQLDWTIYDAGLRDAQRHQLAAQRSELDLRLAALHDTVSDDIANAAGAVETPRRALETAKRSVELSTETLALVARSTWHGDADRPPPGGRRAHRR